MYQVGIRKKLLGIGEYNFGVLYLVGLTIREFQINVKASEKEYEEIWELWEWMVFWQATQGSITEDEFLRLYRLLGKEVLDLKFEYQSNDNERGHRFALLYADLQSVLRPSLSVAFLPLGHGSENWPLTGRPVRNVKLQEGYGSTLPEQLIQKIEDNGFVIEFASPQCDAIYIVVSAFIQILKGSNDKSRSERIGLKATAYEILPFFICFNQFKVMK
jgi:hypothetical protein